MNVVTKFLLVALLAIAGVSPVMAYDLSINTTHVLKVNGTFVPTSVDFTVDVAAGGCIAGGTLTYTPNGADADTIKKNVQAVYALLLLAKSTGQNVAILGTLSGCTVQYIWLN